MERTTQPQSRPTLAQGLYARRLTALFLAALVLPFAHGVGKLFLDRSVPFGDALRYYKLEQLPIRRTLIGQYGWLRRTLFGLYPPRVVPGTEGFYFYNSEASKDGPTTQDFRGQVQPNRETLASWQRVLAARQAWLSARKIEYLLVAAPNKHTIYAEHLPPEELRRRGGRVRLDALIEILDTTEPKPLAWPLLDLRPLLLARKSSGLLYHKTDSHWNQLGAFYSQQAIIERLRAHHPALRPLELSSFSVETTPHRGDLLHMDVLFEGYMEPAPFLRPKHDLPARFAASGETVLTRDRAVPVSFDRWGEAPLGGSCITVHPDASLPSAIIFHDSYMVSLMPFLAQHFRRAVFVWGEFDPALVERERPELIIHEKVERYLDFLFRPELPAAAR